MNNNVFIFHGTEGYPEENWFPWLKQELEQKGCKVFVPQFPSPPIVPAKISEWFDVLKDFEEYINEDTILIGHSLGGIFTLRILEKLKHSIKAAFFVGTPIKDVAPNQWDISVAGHIPAGSDGLTTALREIEEELGIHIEQKNLEYLFTATQSKIKENYINNEFDEVYLVKLDLDISKVVLQKEELTEIKFIHFIKLEKLINSDNDKIFVSHDEEYKKLFELLCKR